MCSGWFVLLFQFEVQVSRVWDTSVASCGSCRGGAFSVGDPLWNRSAVCSQSIDMSICHGSRIVPASTSAHCTCTLFCSASLSRPFSRPLSKFGFRQHCKQYHVSLSSSSCSLSMSLREVWDAAASSPFEPSVGKDSQLAVGLVLIFTGAYLHSAW